MRDFEILLSRYRKLRRRHTLPGLLLKLLSKSLEKVFVLHRAVLREWQVPPSVVDADNPIMLAREGDIDESYDDLWYSREQAIALLRQGHQLFLWKENGKIIYYQWFMRGRVDIPHLDLVGIEVPSDVAYAATAYVPPEHAGRLLFKRAQRYTEAWSMEGGFRGLFSLIDQRADAIDRFHERVLKTKRYQQVTYLRILFFKCYRVVSADGAHRRWFINTNVFWNLFSTVLKARFEPPVKAESQVLTQVQPRAVPVRPPAQAEAAAQIEEA